MRRLDPIRRMLPAGALLVCQAVFAAGAAAQSLSTREQTVPAQADTTTSTGLTRGLAASVRLSVSDSSQGAFTQVVPRIGYDIGRWGVDLSVPFEYIGTSSTTPGTTSHGGVGDVRLSLSYARASSVLNVFTIAAVTAPTGDSTVGLGAGESTWDWTNHFDHYFTRFTPFIALGVGSSVGSGTGTTRLTGATGQSRTFAAPYTTVGKLAHLDAGVDWYLWGPLSWSVSAYDTAPWGDQTVISLFVPQTQTGQILGPRRKRAFEVQAVTQGTSSLTADHGFSTSLDISPTSYLYLSVAFSRSVRLSYNVVTVSVGANLARLYRETRQRP